MTSNLHLSPFSTAERNSDGQAIHRMWQIFDIQPGQVIELRAIKPKIEGFSRNSVTRHFRVHDQPSIQVCKTAFENTAMELNRQGFNIYIVMNPIRSDFSGIAAKDADIACRRLLLVDIDRAGAKENPASDEELAAAKSVAFAIATFTNEAGWLEPIVVMSGNGYHLYYRMEDLPNTKEVTALVSTTLKNFAQKFNTEKIEVDVTVFNASRITKVPETIARKGTEASDRPYRKAVVL